MYLSKFVPKSFKLPIRFYYHKFRRMHERELELMSTLVRRGGVCLDVGAFNGDYAYAMSKFAKRVVCFEPQLHLASEIAAYGSPIIEVKNIGLSDSEGELQLNVPLDTYGRPNYPLATFREYHGPSEIIKIPVATIDSFEFTDVALIKIDVEGFEGHVLRGAKQTLIRERPLLIVEIEERHLSEVGQSMNEIFEFITGLGYSGSFFDGIAQRPLADFCYEKHQLPFLSAPDSSSYINNFIFSPTASPSVRRFGA